MSVTVHVKSNAEEAPLRELLDLTRHASPVFDSITNAVAIDSALERIERGSPKRDAA
ncbi:MAG: hypothetical protein ACREJG_01340 [Candidatus Rokuibacteriota bacterium]